MGRGMYQFWVFIHLVGVFGFLLAHGVSAAVTMSLRRERDPQRIQALLELSSWTLGGFYISILILLAGGITAGFLGHWWGDGWIWAALGVLVAMMVAMYGLASTYYRRVRQAVGLQTSSQAQKQGILPGPPASPEELSSLLRSSRPLLIIVVGIGGLLLILWLMVFKPF
jgi:hypothetical protein